MEIDWRIDTWNSAVPFKCLLSPASLLLHLFIFVTMNEAGHGVQVVNVQTDHSYKLDEAALERILLRKDIKDLPVVVVSVAGAYRGGKSFLLNFFLRYLKAPQSAQSNGTWLAAAGDTLTGFSWRGGSERNTTGILMWSEPIISALPSGDKVAILIMDTQGTFDSTSTIRDCSTIFALSTLISSVQIYNLSMNIQEDDLQHLQLFTDYGRLIKQQSGKAFQVLEFLVRDWSYPFEHPYGAGGGQTFLEKRLEIRKEYPKELQELRQHIRSSFDTVTCFLMPHPGFGVLNPKFKGQITEIGSEFKEMLVELVASIFDPAKLTPKMINGQLVKASELFTYFKTYMNIFNSDTIPTPVSILKATSEAGMLTAMMEARELYEAGMERECGEGKPSLSPVVLQELHRNTLAAARAAFVNKKKMGSQEDSDKYLSKVTKELDAHLSQYVKLNIAKIQKTINDAKEAYEESLRNVSKDQLLCLHPYDLEKVHNDAVEVAMRIFDAGRKPILKAKDEDKDKFMKSFEHRYSLLRLSNDQNNKMNVTNVREEYWNHMQSLCFSKPPLDPVQFEQKHNEALEHALESFKSKRNRPDAYTDDIYKFSLVQKILANFIQLQAINRSNNKEAFQAAIAAYNEYIAAAWDSEKVCLHPDDLKNEHETGKCKALLAFRPSRSCAVGFTMGDVDEAVLLEIFRLRLLELRETNDSANQAAVQAAFNEYDSRMTNDCQPSWWWLLVVPIIISIAKKSKYHENAKEAAMSVFFGRRRDSRFHASDPYIDNLNKMMNDAYPKY